MLQNYEEKTEEIRKRFVAEKIKNPERFHRRIDLSWSIWMFGVESLKHSLERLKRYEIGFVELKGDHHTESSGLPETEIRRALDEAEMSVSGACGLFSSEADLSSNSVYVQQNAIRYIRRELDLLEHLGGRYLIVVPGAVGRPDPTDSFERQRSANSLRRCVEAVPGSSVRIAIEPIRSAEVSLVHTVTEALDYIKEVGNPIVSGINADTYHMSLEESHVGNAILSCGDALANLHLADTNRDALGKGMLDLDTVIMAAYLAGMNREGRFLTPEPLGPVPDPYVLSHRPCDTRAMDQLVRDTIECFRQREEIVLNMGQ